MHWKPGNVHLLLQDGNTRLNIYKLEIFEILLYFIFKKEIELGLHRDKYVWMGFIENIDLH